MNIKDKWLIEITCSSKECIYNVGHANGHPDYCIEIDNNCNRYECPIRLGKGE